MSKKGVCDVCQMTVSLLSSPFEDNKLSKVCLSPIIVSEMERGYIAIRDGCTLVKCDIIQIVTSLVESV